jgi:hypothetical protein
MEFKSAPLIVWVRIGAMPGDLLADARVLLNVGAIQNGSLRHEHYSSAPSKTLRAAMGFSVRFAGSPGHAKDRPIEKLIGRHCSAWQRPEKNHPVETTPVITPSQAP